MSILDLTWEELHELYNDPIPEPVAPPKKPTYNPKRAAGYYVRGDSDGFYKCCHCKHSILVQNVKKRHHSNPICPICLHYFDGDNLKNHAKVILAPAVR